MTAWQDPPLQSRRQMRLEEQRAHGRVDSDATLNTDHVADEQPSQSLPIDIVPGISVPPQQSPTAHEGRHGRRAEAAELDSRHTQRDSASEERQPLSAAGDASTGPLRPRTSEHHLARATEAPHSSFADVEAAEPAPRDELRAYRFRDFSPEARRSAFQPTSELAPSNWSQPGAAGEPGNLDYFTQQGPGRQGATASLEQPVADPLTVQQSVTEQTGAGVFSEHTLTRRQLRAMRAATAGLTSAEPVATDHEVSERAPELQTPLAPQPQSTSELSSALAEFDSLMARGAVKEPEHDPQVSHDRDTERLIEVDSVPLTSMSSEEVATPEMSKPRSIPTGHWSTQASASDDAESIVLRRNIAATSGAVTSSHLVISSVPNVKDLLLPFNATGEIMVTGTIDLPRSLGSTGAHPARYDHSDVDALLEASDREDSNVDSAPVRATRAISTHTSSGSMITTGKPIHSSKVPMILAVSTAAAAAVVVGLFVAGFVLHLF